MKTGMYRDVPLHSHLIAMGFLEFVAKQPAGPLFYAHKTKSASPWATTSGRLCGWVRETAKVTDPRVKPNHGWRHAFQTVGRVVGVDRFYRNGICGQSLGNTEGDNYGDTPMSAVKRELEKWPRWEV